MNHLRPAHLRRSTRGVATAALGLTAVAVAAASLAATASAAPAHGSTATGAHLAGTRADVPWAKVGRGWTLATWSRTASVTSKAPTTLFLVSPGGARYSIKHLGAQTRPLAWAPGGARAVLEGGHGTREINLHTGAVTKVHLRQNGIVQYTRPDGAAFISEVDTKNGEYLDQHLARVGRNGKHLVVFPTSVKGAGDVSPYGALQTRKGTLLVAGARHGLVVFGPQGHVVHRLMGAHDDCTVASWWTKGVVLARCGKGGLWTVPVGGGRSKRITDARSKENPFGYSEAWTTPDAGRLGLAENGCGPETLVRFSGGHGDRVTIPSPTGKQGLPSYVGHHGDVVDMLYSAAQGCMSARTVLFGYDAADDTSTTLLGAGVNGGSVLGALTFGD